MKPPNYLADALNPLKLVTKERRYQIHGDGSGHKYFVEVGMEGEFEAWLAAELAYEHVGYEGHDYNANRIDGRFTFTDPRVG